MNRDASALAHALSELRLDLRHDAVALANEHPLTTDDVGAPAGRRTPRPTLSRSLP